MKIALSQNNYHVGNFEDNRRKIVNSIREAKAGGADIVVFSELSVCGYPSQDLYEQREYIASCRESIELISHECKGIAAVVGAPRVNENERGKKLYNSAYFLADGQVQSIHDKVLLPTYDIFDEYRYFEPGGGPSPAEYLGKKIAITICEDLWDNQPVENSFDREKLYVRSPLDEITARHKIDFVINIAASPYSAGHEADRRGVLAENARKYRLPIVYVNQVGGNTEILFDGSSLVIGSTGSQILGMKSFEKDFQWIDLSEKIELVKPAQTSVNQENLEALVMGVRDYFRKSGFQKAVLGLSGGLDSALTLYIASLALGAENVRALLMPSRYSSGHSVDDARQLAEKLGCPYDIVPVQETVDAYEKALKPLFGELPADVTEENIQARTRGVLLMAMSNKFGAILLNTSNKSEAAVGYTTLYGDMNGGLSVIGDLYKTEIFEMARYINRDEEIIPWHTIEKPPSAELKPDQQDSDSLPDYQILDRILYDFIELKKTPDAIIAETGYDEALVLETVGMVNRNEYKRFQAPPILRVSGKAFGIGRRIPIVARH
jgi:NAD+ synthase (glutamine-hydrolysing)